MRVDAAQLFREHYDALFRYLLRFSGDSEVAADAAQEAFVRLVAKPPRTRHVRAWLYAVATNAVRDTVRGEARHAALLHAHAGRIPMADAPPVPDDELERCEERALVRRALDALSLKERTVLLMREEGFSHREIASAVGTRTGAVGTMLARALRKLTEQLHAARDDRPFAS